MYSRKSIGCEIFFILSITYTNFLWHYRGLIDLKVWAINLICFTWLPSVSATRCNPTEKLAEGSYAVLYNDEALHIYRNICLYSILDREHPSSTFFLHTSDTLPALTHSITDIGNAGVAVKLGIDRPLPLWRLLNQSSCSSSFCPFRLFRIKQIRVRRIAISVAPAVSKGGVSFSR